MALAAEGVSAASEDEEPLEQLADGLAAHAAPGVVVLESGVTAHDEEVLPV